MSKLSLTFTPRYASPKNDNFRIAYDLVQSLNKVGMFRHLEINTGSPFVTSSRPRHALRGGPLLILGTWPNQGSLLSLKNSRIECEKGQQSSHPRSPSHTKDENMAAASSPSTTGKKSIRPHRKSRGGCGLCKRRKVKVCQSSVFSLIHGRACFLRAWFYPRVTGSWSC